MAPVPSWPSLFDPAQQVGMIESHILRQFGKSQSPPQILAYNSHDAASCLLTPAPCFARGL